MNVNKTSKRFLVSLFFLTLIGISYDSVTYTSGPPAMLTNAPGEGDCTSCHSGSLQTSGTNYNNVTFSGPFTGGGYIPDSLYDVTLTYSHTGKSKFGFSATILNSNDAMAGSLTNINSTVSTNTGTVSGATRTYVRHTSAGTSGTNGRSWTFRWTAPSSNVGDVTLYAVVNATNSNNQNSGDIIIAKEFTITPSTLLPVATASASASSVCQSSSLSLMGSATNSPTSYSWSIVGGNPSSSTSQNPSVVFNVQGNYNAILTATNAKGASLPDTVSINVLPGATAFIGGSANRTICNGDSVEITANFLAGQTYTWNDGTTGNVIWAKDTGDYFVTVIGSNGCARISNTVSVSHYPKPVASLSSNASNFNDSSCTNSTLTLMSTTTTFDSFYYYKNGVEIGRSASSSFATTFTTSATYGLVVLDSNGCKSDMDMYDVIAKTKQIAPVVSCTIRTPSTIEYSFTSPFNHLGYQVSEDSGFVWSTPSSGSTGNTHEVTGLQPGDSVQLWVRSIDNAPCFTSLVGVETCAADTCTQLEVTYQTDSAYCFGDVATVEINGLSGESFGLTFAGGGVFTDTIFQFQPTISKDYKLTVIDSSYLFCPANEVDIPIHVDKVNDINLQSDKLGAYCQDDTITYIANDTLENFNFVVNNSSVQNGNSNSYVSTSLANGDEIYVVVEKGVCTDTSQTEIVVVEAPGDATFTSSRTGSVYTFTPTDVGHMTYAWDFGDMSTSSDVMPTHDYASSEGQTVTVTLDITTSNNCLNSNNSSVTLPMFSGLDDLMKLGLTIYPNPVTDKLIIENSTGKKVGVQLLNQQGVVIFTTEMLSNEKVIDMEDFSAGFYMLVAKVDEETVSVRIIKN